MIYHKLQELKLQSSNISLCHYIMYAAINRFKNKHKQYKIY